MDKLLPITNMVAFQNITLQEIQSVVKFKTVIYKNVLK